MRCNDYIKLTKGYLKNYTYYKQAVKNLELDITDLERELGSYGIKVASYGPQVGGGASALNGTERGAADRMDMEHELVAKRSELIRIKAHIGKLETAIGMLPHDEQEIARLYFIERLNYAQITGKVYFSERWIRTKLNTGVKAVAIMLFGEKADSDVVFVQSA